LRGFPELFAGGAAFLVAFLISVILTPIVRKWAQRKDFVDHPAGEGGHHKTHLQPTPFGGGIAILTAIFLPIVVVMLMAFILRDAPAESINFLGELMPQWPAYLGGVSEKASAGVSILFGGLILHIVGLVDDKRPVSAFCKLALQIAVALMLTWGVGIRAGEMLGTIPAILLTTFWIVTLTNAFNFMDNMDGLSAGVAALASLVLAIAAFRAGQLFVPCMLLLVTGAVAGFLIYNFPPASIFMGDAGSLVLGYFLAVCAVLITYYDPAEQQRPFGILVPIVVFAIPLYDLLTVVVRRWWTGKSIFQSDRGHFSHRLVMLGLGRTAAVLTIYLATLATALPAIMLPLVDWPNALLIIGQCVCVVAIIAVLEQRHAGE
jgi:UDP-GlcNAc:undecaprenyl-phosphate GlcNAc-1-phosphate transferase